jgi:16S rRNA (uracil1498-N3)-methyltransferase
MKRLDRVLNDWDTSRQIMFCDEATATDPATPFEGGAGPWAILIGPEGGFSPNERKRLRGLECAHVAQLGPRILRADTAAVAALTLWQTALGDWK